MPSRDYYLRGVGDENVQIYEKFAIDVAMMFGADEAQARKDMREMVELEIELANVNSYRFYFIFFYLHFKIFIELEIELANVYSYRFYFIFYLHF